MASGVVSAAGAAWQPVEAPAAAQGRTSPLISKKTPSAKDIQVQADFGLRPTAQPMELSATPKSTAVAVGIFQVLGLPHLKDLHVVNRRWKHADFGYAATNLLTKKLALKRTDPQPAADQMKMDAEKPETAATLPTDDTSRKIIAAWLAELRPPRPVLLEPGKRAPALTTPSPFQSEREEETEIAAKHASMRQLFIDACAETVRLTAQAVGMKPETLATSLCEPTLFHQVCPSTHSLKEYIERIDRYALTGPDEDVYLGALFYMDRLLQIQEAPLTLYNAHRVVLTALLIANKKVFDVIHLNSFWHKVGGIANIKELEVEFPERLAWKIGVGDAQMQRAKNGLQDKVKVPTKNSATQPKENQ